MTATRQGWRAGLAAIVSAAMAGTAIGAATYALTPTAAGRLAVGWATPARYAPAARQVLPFAVLVRTPAGHGPGLVFNDRGRHRSQRALGADATSVQIQLPGSPLDRAARLAGMSLRAARSAPSATPWSQTMTAQAGHGQLPAAGRQPAPILASQAPSDPHHSTAVTAIPMPRWRAILEDRWQTRLREVTELSLAYHDTAERTRGESRSGDHAAAPQLQQLMRQAVTARRALADTEEALGRLSAGRYGRCELCTAVIPLRRLALAPEARYCPRCAPDPPATPLASHLPASGLRRQHAPPPHHPG